MLYEIAAGGHLHWHTDETEESHAGQGVLQVEHEEHPVGPRSVSVLPADVRFGTGDEPLRAVAFLAAAMFTQRFDNVLTPPGSKVIGTPNREC